MHQYVFEYCRHQHHRDIFVPIISFGSVQVRIEIPIHQKLGTVEALEYGRDKVLNI